MEGIGDVTGQDRQPRKGPIMSEFVLWATEAQSY